MRYQMMMVCHLIQLLLLLLLSVYMSVYTDVMVVYMVDCNDLFLWYYVRDCRLLRNYLWNMLDISDFYLQEINEEFSSINVNVWFNAFNGDDKHHKKQNIANFKRISASIGWSSQVI